MIRLAPATYGFADGFLDVDDTDAAHALEFI
jgi:hypothetical protein